MCDLKCCLNISDHQINWVNSKVINKFGMQHTILKDILSICLFLSVSVLFVCIFVFLSTILKDTLSIYMSIFLFLFFLFVYLYVCLPFRRISCLAVCQSVCFCSFCLCICISVSHLERYSSCHSNHASIPVNTEMG